MRLVSLAMTLGLIANVHVAAVAEAAEAEGQVDMVVLENDYLKVSVSPVGAKIVSLVDKIRNREEVKNLPYAGGMNVIRYGRAMNVDDQKTVYDLKLTKLPDGTQKLVATTRIEPDEERPATGIAIKEYVLAPQSSSVRLALELRNQGTEEIGLIPWVWHLINRGTKEHPEEAHMTRYGAFITNKPRPDARTMKIVSGTHHFPASNWISRVVLPLEDGSNTLATVTRPQDMLKIYTWHRQSENFATQETIAAPIFAEPGKSGRWDYFLVMTAPVPNIVYCSPDLVIGASPHPTWLSANDKELALDFSSTQEMAGVAVTARVVKVGEENTPISTSTFALEAVSPKSVTTHKIPVSLQDQTCYQLRLTFSRDGQAYFPGAAAEDRSEVIIPLVVGMGDQSTQVFADQTQRDARLRHIQPKARKGTLAYSGEAFNVFSFPTAQRAYREDTFEANGAGPVQLFASAGEYESAQIVLTPKAGSETTYQVEATPLTGPDGGQVQCESVNDFIYVPTHIPSGYNAMFPIGNYPEALIPTKQVVLKPQGNHPLFVTYHVSRDAKPGVYKGTVVLTEGSTRHAVPVEMTVWNVQMPLRSRGMEFASSLKGNTLPEARHADGTPLTREEQLKAIVDMHLKYRLTPCDTGLANVLLRGELEAFEKEMQRFIDAGATKIYLGSARTLVETYSPEKLAEIEAYLNKKGWTDHFFVRAGFDEASSDLIPRIRAACEAWKKVSKIRIMETYYHDDAEELYGFIDIWSRNMEQKPWMDRRRAAGDTFWKVNAMPGTLEVEPWEGARKRYVSLWDYQFTGSYNWTVKQWSGVKKWGEDYWCDAGVGNLAAVLMWPHESGILSTIRLEAMRDGLEDNAMLWMLRDKVDALAGKTPNDPAQAKALEDARALCSSGPLSAGIKSAEDVERLRERVGNALSVLNTIP